MKTYLIRHGSTWANEQKPYILQGRSLNLPLSANGVKQAQDTAAFFNKKPIKKVFCSPLKRALETASIIAEANQMSIEVIEDLTEGNLGLWEQLTWEEIKRKYPVDYGWFISDTGYRRYMNGESYNDVLKRVRPVFEKITAGTEDVAVVSHSIVNKAYLAHLLNLSLDIAKKLPQHNCGINIIGNESALTINYTDHLTDG